MLRRVLASTLQEMLDRNHGNWVLLQMAFLLSVLLGTQTLERIFGLVSAAPRPRVPPLAVAAPGQARWSTQRRSVKASRRAAYGSGRRAAATGVT